MESSWPKNFLSGREKMVAELVQGRGFANQLKILLDKPCQNDGSVSREDLSEKILDSFANALSMFSNFVESHEFSQTMMNPVSLSSRCSEFLKSKDAGESLKGVFMQKDERGCYKIRKNTKNTNVWERYDSPTLIDDGYIWRKYGQKQIHNFKHPTSYFRCTYKFDQVCQASKHVQKIRDNPPVYRTTYFGHHTCKNFLTASQLISCYTDDIINESSNMIRFDKYDHKEGVFPLIMRSVKQEIKSEIETTKDDDHSLDDHNAAEESWPSDHIMKIGSCDPFGAEPMVDEFDLSDSLFDFNGYKSMLL